MTLGPGGAGAGESAPDFRTAFDLAAKLHSAGRLGEAERAYRELAAPGPDRETVLRALVELYMQGGRAREAVDTLVELTHEVPDSLYYYARLATLLDGLGQIEAATGHYLRLLERQPALAGAHFNLALLYKKMQRYADALAEYEEAVRLGIENVQEAYSNMGVLYSEMRQKEQAREMYERALAIDPGYLTALFNLAGLLEESGDKQQAIALYERILSADPRHWDSLARLAYARKVTSADRKLVESLQQAAKDAKDDWMAREGLYFALGKALDDLEQYDEAFAAYSVANELGKLRNRPYDRAAIEQTISRLMDVFNPAWMQASATALTESPIFICGMLRSGSTLVEQVLASHPLVTAGGELDFLPRLVARYFMPYPERVQAVSLNALEEVGNGYLSKLRELFPEARNLTDKRPDNFLHLGLIKVLFPAARIIYTKRNPLDNCLSIYFQQLGGNLNYATDLENIAHYYRQHERVMRHWLDSLGDSLFTVDYDEFVRSPEPVLRRLLDFLGLEWDELCLAFQRTDSLVKTASVWQVRDELHSQSSGRWKRYESHIRNIQGSFQRHG